MLFTEVISQKQAVEALLYVEYFVLRNDLLFLICGNEIFKIVIHTQKKNYSSAAFKTAVAFKVSVFLNYHKVLRLSNSSSF